MVITFILNFRVIRIHNVWEFFYSEVLHTVCCLYIFEPSLSQLTNEHYTYTDLTTCNSQLNLSLCWYQIIVVLNTLAVPSFVANEKRASNETEFNTKLLWAHINQLIQSHFPVVAWHQRCSYGREFLADSDLWSHSVENAEESGRWWS